MTSQQLFLHRRSLAATEWFCTRCGAPPRHAGGLCDRCAASPGHERKEPTPVARAAAAIDRAR